MGVSGQVEKEELLLLVFALGWASSLSPFDIVERLPFNLGEECDYLVCLQLLNFGSQEVPVWIAFFCWVQGRKTPCCSSVCPVSGPQTGLLPSYHFSEFSFCCLLCNFHGLQLCLVRRGRKKQISAICIQTESSNPLIFVNLHDLHLVGYFSFENNGVWIYAL